MGEPIYVETWEVIRTWEVVGNPKGNLLDIAYTRSMCPTVEMTDIFRRSMAETHECVLCKLLKARKVEFDGE